MTCRLVPRFLPLLVVWQCVPTGPALAQQAPARPRGHVFHQTDFEAADATRGWARSPKLGAGFQSARGLVFERGADGPGDTTLAELALPVEAMRGHDVYVAAMVKAENVVDTPARYHGIRLTVVTVRDGEKTYVAANVGKSTFDWKPVVFHARVPHDATAFSLLAGLQGVSGKAWFDNVRVIVRKPPRVSQPRPAAVYTGRDLPRLRGMQVSPGIDEDSLRELGREWNANVVRLMLVRRGREALGDPLDLAAYDRWLDAELDRLDAALQRCERHGLMAVVDLHSPPGGGRTPAGYIGVSDGLFTNPACQKKFVETWERIARRYKGARAVWGHDLGNEPQLLPDVDPGRVFEGAVVTLQTPLRKEGEGLDDWEDLAARAARAVRAIDPRPAIILEPPQGYSPQGLAGFQPLDLPDVVYSVHMYVPSAFTHQGVHELQDRVPWVKKYRYPGVIEGQTWDRARLEKALEPVIDFQRRYNAHIFIGEFSAIRWAPDDSAYRYLKDVIDLFEEHGWDWTYHCYREGWDGWSVEHGPDLNDHALAKRPTTREALLRDWYARNQKPAWYRAP